jgi:hypothetical protein
MDVSNPAAPVCVDDLTRPAPDLTSQERNLGAAVDRLRDDPTFENAKLFCLNARFGWAGIHSRYRSLEPEPEKRQQLLGQFIILMKEGRLLLAKVQTGGAEVARLLPRYLRSCTARWDWARLLVESKDLDPVNQAMDEYREALRNAHDSED